MSKAFSVVRIQRLILGMTQDELAKKIGCSRPCISLIEHGRVRPGRELTEKLIATLGLPIDEREEDKGE